MYILSQDQKIIINFGGTDGAQTLEVHKNLGGGKDAKFAIITNGLQTIGIYPEEKNAVAELLNILSALESEKKIYRIS